MADASENASLGGAPSAERSDALFITEEGNIATLDAGSGLAGSKEQSKRERQSDVPGMH